MPSNSPSPIVIPAEVARRFLLGRQGLWAGTRWKGRAGTLNAIQAIGAVQMDPLTIVARSHDLVLWNRVAGYRPEHLEHWCATDRRLFDYGGVLRIQPIEELPYWRLHMARHREDPKYYLPLKREHSDLFTAVRNAIETSGSLSAKAIARVIDDGTLAERTTSAGTVGSYRSGSVVGRVAYQMWLTGELMTDHRVGFERHYDLAERTAPADLLNEMDEPAVIEHFATAILSPSGFLLEVTWRSTMAYILHRKIEVKEAKDWLTTLLAEGLVTQVKVEGQRGTYLANADATGQLHALMDGKIPAGWGRQREPMVRLLSPLDPIVAGGRAKSFFGFEHIWEIYKPAEKRQFGPYTMPILYGDALVGRLDPRADRETGTLHINGVWLEQPDLAKDDQFTRLLAEEIRALAAFTGAEDIEVHHCDPASLKSHLA